MTAAGSGRGGKAGSATDREARLKAALKANMARRKAQLRARSGGTGGGAVPVGPASGASLGAAAVHDTRPARDDGREARSRDDGREAPGNT